MKTTAKSFFGLPRAAVQHFIASSTTTPSVVPMEITTGGTTNNNTSAGDIVRVCATPQATIGGITDPTIVSAINKMWRNDFSGAEADLLPYNDRLPRYSLHFAEISLIRAVMIGSKTALNTSLDLLSKTETLVESFLSNHPTKAIQEGMIRNCDALNNQIIQNVHDDLSLIHADLSLFSGALLFYLGHKLRSAWKLHKSWSIYKSLLVRKSPPIVSSTPISDGVKFGAGLFMFLISWLPQTIVNILQLVGFESDRRRGLSLLSDVSVGESVRSPMASMFLLTNLLAIPRALSSVNEILKESRPVLERSLNRWPNSSAFLWTASLFERKCGEAEHGLQLIEQAITSCKNSMNGHCPSVLEMDRGCCLSMCFRWNEAAMVFAKLQDDQQNSLRGMCQILHAACKQMEGDTKSAISLLKTMPNEANLIGKDKLAVGLAARGLTRKSGLTLFPFEILYLRRDLAHMKQESIKKQLEQLELAFSINPKDHTREEYAAFLLVHGSMLYLIGDINNAIKELSQCANESVSFKIERHVASFAHCELAEIAYRNGDINEAKKLLKIATKHAKNDDSWADLILPRMRIALEQIRMGEVSVVS